jgi:thiol peroxidase
MRRTVVYILLSFLVCVSGCDRGEKMKERDSIVTMKGNPVILLGEEIKVGQPAPDFEVVGNDLSAVKLSDYAGKVCVISSVPSLDTPVCDVETRRFNEEAGKLGGDVVVLTISMDLPFAQKRWCAAAGIENVVTLSDYKDASFGKAYGVLIKDLKLLARAVFIVDGEGVIRYVQIVPEIAQEPDYEAVLQALKDL